MDMKVTKTFSVGNLFSAQSDPPGFRNVIKDRGRRECNSIDHKVGVLNYILGFQRQFSVENFLFIILMMCWHGVVCRGTEEDQEGGFSSFL